MKELLPEFLWEATLADYIGWSFIWLTFIWGVWHLRRAEARQDAQASKISNQTAAQQKAGPSIATPEDAKNNIAVVLKAKLRAAIALMMMAAWYSILLVAIVILAIPPRWDMTGDGIVTISDVWAWLEWPFYRPGDVALILLLHHAEGIAQFFELTAVNAGGTGSMAFSCVFWIIVVKIYLTLED